MAGGQPVSYHPQKPINNRTAHSKTFSLDWKKKNEQQSFVIKSPMYIRSSTTGLDYIVLMLARHDRRPLPRVSMGLIAVHWQQQQQRWRTSESRHSRLWRRHATLVRFHKEEEEDKTHNTYGDVKTTCSFARAKAYTRMPEVKRAKSHTDRLFKKKHSSLHDIKIKERNDLVRRRKKERKTRADKSSTPPLRPFFFLF